MPTVGWIREGDWEAFLEAREHISGPLPPLPERFPCPFCSSVFDTRISAQNHISANHYVARPTLLLASAGGEPGRISTIRRQIQAREVFVANATSAALRIDGAPREDINPADLPMRLSDLKWGRVELALVNASQAYATPVTSEYEIFYRITTSSDCRQVEVAFADRIMSAPLTRTSIDTFLGDERCAGTGSDYARGLANFTLGILQKERPANERLTTPFAQYRESYASALRILQDYQRPFPRLISQVIRFALNDFSHADTRTGFWDLDFANALLGQIDLPEDTDQATKRHQVCPIDHGTGQILDLAVRMYRQRRWSPILDNECRQIANADVLDTLDREKALAIWSKLTLKLGAKESAIEPLRQISATYPFRTWAEPALEMVTK